MINEEKIKFAHDEETIHEAMGISEEEIEDFVGKMTDVIDSIEGEQASQSQCIEAFLTSDMLEDNEKLFAIYHFSKMQAQMPSMEGLMQMMVQQDGGEA